MKNHALGALLAKVAIGALALGAVLVPATSASALSIDCTYSPGLSAFVERLQDPSLTCRNFGGPSGTTPGGGSIGDRPGNSIGGRASTAVSACKYPMPDMPDWLYSNGTVFASDLPPFYYPDPAGSDDVFADYRTEYRDAHGTVFAHRDYVVSTKRSLTTPARFYLSDFNVKHFPAEITQEWRCDWPTWGAIGFTDMSPTTGTIDPITGPDVNHEYTKSPIKPTSSLVAVPGKPGQHFYRLNIENTSPTDTHPGLVTMRLDDFGLMEILGMPAGANCPASTPTAEVCTAPAILPGQTQIFTFLVTAKTAPGATAILNTQVDTFLGRSSRVNGRPSITGAWTVAGF